jgi:hypothetical protein
VKIGEVYVDWLRATRVNCDHISSNSEIGTENLEWLFKRLCTVVVLRLSKFLDDIEIVVIPGYIKLRAN